LAPARRDVAAHGAMVARDSSAAAAALQTAAARVAAARDLLRAAAAAAAADADENGAEQNRLPAAHLDEALERLRPLRRLLDESSEDLVTRGLGPDEQLQANLHRRSCLLEEREELDRLIASEEAQVAELRRSCKEVDNAVGKDRRRRERVEDCSFTSRAAALEKRKLALSDVVEQLMAETKVVQQQIVESKAKMHDEDKRTVELEREHAAAAAENQRARVALKGDDGVVQYRRKKELERAAADATLERAHEAHQAATLRYEEQMANEQAACDATAAELAADLQELRSRLAQEQAQARTHLAQQAAEHCRALQEIDFHAAAELQRLEDERQQRSVVLRREVAQTRQMIEDAKTSAARHLEAHMKEMKLAFSNRLHQEQARAEHTIQAELKAATDAQRDRQEWERKAGKAKDDFRVHSMKSHTYVKSLDAPRRQGLESLLART